MKQKILFALLAVVCLVGCGNEEEDVLLNNLSMPFAGVWDITEVNMDGSWQSAKSAGYGNTYVIFSEDSCYQTDGRFGSSYYHYKVEGGRIICTDYYDKLQLICQFKSISGQAATATITDNSGKTLDFRMKRDESNPAKYKNPVKYLDGYWDIDGVDGGVVDLYEGCFVIISGIFDYRSDVERSTWDIGHFKFGSYFVAVPDLSSKPWKLNVSRTNFGQEYRNVNFTCTKRAE